MLGRGADPGSDYHLVRHRRCEGRSCGSGWVPEREGRRLGGRAPFRHPVAGRSNAGIRPYELLELARRSVRAPASGHRPRPPERSRRGARPRARLRRGRRPHPVGACCRTLGVRRRPGSVALDDPPRRGTASARPAGRPRRAPGRGCKLDPIRRRVLRRALHVVHARAVRHSRDPARAGRMPPRPSVRRPPRRRRALAGDPDRLADAALRAASRPLPHGPRLSPDRAGLALQEAGFDGVRSTVAPLWGLRAEAVVAVRPSTVRSPAPAETDRGQAGM